MARRIQNKPLQASQTPRMEASFASPSQKGFVFQGLSF